jgi:hypothetical protein
MRIVFHTLTAPQFKGSELSHGRAIKIIDGKESLCVKVMKEHLN